MRTRIANSEDIQGLKKLVVEWKDDCNGGLMGFELNTDTYLTTLKDMVSDIDSDIILLVDGDIIVGYMGVEWFVSPLGPNRIGNEHYWFVSKEHRGYGSMLLFEAAKKWCKDNRCSHIMMNASTLASDMHDKMCNLYEKYGMSKFETSYIKEIV